MNNFYQQVGNSGLLIAILGLIAVFMAIRGTVLIVLIKRQAREPHSLIEQIITQTRALNSDLISEVTKVSSADSKAQVDKELIINTLMQVQMKGVYSSMYFLKLCAAVGPLLGLLGTVLGMIDVFSTLSSKAMPEPSLLAGGIWEALLTTVMGLTLAIPALIVHYFLLMSLRSIRNQINLKVAGIKLSNS